MELIKILITYIFLLIIIFFIFKIYGNITIWSSFILSILISLVLISIIFPVSSFEKILSGEPVVNVYLAIFVITILILIFYIVERALKDKNRTNCSIEYVGRIDEMNRGKKIVQ